MAVLILKSLNYLLIFALFAKVVEIVAYLIAGDDVFRQGAFLSFFIIEATLSSLIAILLLSYYWFKNYKQLFFIHAISVLFTFIYFAIIIKSLLFRQEQSLYFLTPTFFVALHFVYGLSLFLSNSRNSYWLKISGISLFLINLLNICVILLLIVVPSLKQGFFLEKLSQWLLQLNGFIPVFFILNCNEELRQPNIMRQSLFRFDFIPWKYIKVIFGIAILIISLNLFVNIYWTLHWANRSFEEAKRLAGSFESRTFVGKHGDTLYFRFLKPLNFDKKKKYPLLISLPYGGQPGNDKIRQLEGAAAAQLLSTKDNREKYPSFLFVPNCPQGAGWGGIAGYPSIDNLVYEAIISLDQELGLDTKRRYVTGISRGGYGTWNFISKRPDLFAAAIPISGGGDTKLIGRAVDVAVWAFHGANDKNVPVANSRELIKAFKKAGGRPKYTEFDNEGHDIWFKVSNTPGLWDWLFNQYQKY